MAEKCRNQAKSEGLLQASGVSALRVSSPQGKKKRNYEPRMGQKRQA